MSKQGSDPHFSDTERRAAALIRATSDVQPMRATFPAELRGRLAVTMQEQPPRLGWRERLDFSVWPARAGLAVGLAALVALAVPAIYPWFTPGVDAHELMNQVQNAGEIVPTGRVRHVVTTYAMTPGLPGGRNSATLEQWFGNANGRLVTRQTGLLGENQLVDAAGTAWHWFPAANEVLKTVGGGEGLPAQTPNRAVIEGIGGRDAQPRVVGHTTVNGRPATTLELTRTLPSMETEIARDARGRGIVATGTPGVVGMAPDVIAFTKDTSGMMLVVPPSGGTIVSQLVVDDESRQIMRGHAVSRDQAGTVVGTTDWQISMDELLDAARVPADLFVFTAPPGSTVREVAPGAPFQIQIPKP